LSPVSLLEMKSGEQGRYGQLQTEGTSVGLWTVGTEAPDITSQRYLVLVIPFVINLA